MDQEKLEEYFKLRDTMRTLKADLKDMVDSHSVTEQLDELKKQVKNLKAELEDEEDIGILKEKIKGLKERSELIKEILLVQMKESGEEKIEFNGNELFVSSSLKIKRIKT